MSILEVMTITKDKYVTIEYSFTSPDGELLGSSDYSGPFTFRQGTGDVVPGLDARIEGHRIGEQLEFVIPPEEAYGLRDEAKVKRLAKQHLPLGREPGGKDGHDHGGDHAIVRAAVEDHISAVVELCAEAFESGEGGL